MEINTHQPPKTFPCTFFPGLLKAQCFLQNISQIAIILTSSYSPRTLQFRHLKQVMLFIQATAMLSHPPSLTTHQAVLGRSQPEEQLLPSAGSQVRRVINHALLRDQEDINEHSRKTHTNFYLPDKDQYIHILVWVPHHKENQRAFQQKLFFKLPVISFTLH